MGKRHKNGRQAVHFFKLSGLPNIRAVRGVNVSHVFQRHVHEGFCIGAVTRGSRVLRYGDAEIIIPGKGLFVINPGEAHACKSGDQEHSYLILSIPAAVMQAVASQISGRAQPVPHFKNIPIYDAELYLKIKCFFMLIDKTCSELERESFLLSLLSVLILRHTEASPRLRALDVHDRTVRRICEFIKMHYAEPLSLKELSAEACLSPFYLQRLFLEKTGISPHDYLAQVRIGKALLLLAEGQAIAHVALDTGFVDQSHFTRTFRKLTGTTPGEYIAMRD